MKNTKLEEIKTLVESEIFIHALICHLQLFTFACHGRKKYVIDGFEHFLFADATIYLPHMQCNK